MTRQPDAREAALTQLQHGCAAAQEQFEIRVAPAGLLDVALARRDPAHAHPVELETLASAELCLTLACVRGDIGALAALERHYFGHVRDVIASFDRAMPREDLLQLARVHLLVGDVTTPPALACFGGRGSLSKWLRVTVKRALLNATRRKLLPTVSLDEDAHVDVITHAMGEPALDFLKIKYRATFRRAFSRAARELSVRQRGLIRHAAVDGLTVRQLGRMFNVHHATAARWVAEAYDALVAATRQHLAAELADDARGVDDVLSLIRSRFDASLAVFADLSGAQEHTQ